MYSDIFSCLVHNLDHVAVLLVTLTLMIMHRVVHCFQTLVIMVVIVVVVVVVVIVEVVIVIVVVVQGVQVFLMVLHFLFALQIQR